MFYSIVLVSVAWAVYARAQSQEWGQCMCLLEPLGKAEFDQAVELAGLGRRLVFLGKFYIL